MVQKVLKGLSLLSTWLLVCRVQTLNFPDRRNLNDQLVEIINKFDRCVIHVINFRGLDVNLYSLRQPIILLRYFSFINELHLYPIEMLVEINNRTAGLKSSWDVQKFGRKFMDKLFRESFRSKRMKLNCETNIYLHPPIEDTISQLYSKNWRWGSVLKDPFWMNFELEYQHQKWKRYFINTIPKFSLLICSFKDPICQMDYHRDKWVAGVLHAEYLVTVPEVILSVEISPTGPIVNVLCPYCDPCNSFKFVSAQISSSNIIENLSEPLSKHPHTLKFRDVYYRTTLENKDERTIQAILKQYQMFSIFEDLDNALGTVELHLISLLYDNSTNITTFDTNPEAWEHVIIRACSATKAIRSHPKFRPSVDIRVFKYFNRHKELGLVFHSSHMAFVSCHKEQKLWTHQLKELIFVFDVATWLLLLISCVALSQFIKSSQLLYGIKNRSTKFWSNFYLVIVSFVDQSVSLYGMSKHRSKNAYFYSMIFVPILWLILSTLYKGDNITRLTAQPPLKPFDTFESLVNNGFRTYVRRYLFNAYSNKESIELTKKYGAVKSHETFPIVSGLWLAVVIGQLREYSAKGRSLNFLKDEISNSTWTYINNTSMFPDFGQGMPENFSDIMNLHMSKCNKSAVLVKKEDAFKVHTILNLKKKPVYLGRDIIAESSMGFIRNGYLPRKLYFKSSYLFQTGIAKWWDDYYKFVLVMKSTIQSKKVVLANKSQNSILEEDKQKVALTVLTFIPGIGLLVSLFVFVAFECQIVEKMKKLFDVILSIHSFYKNKSKALTVTRRDKR